MADEISPLNWTKQQRANKGMEQVGVGKELNVSDIKNHVERKPETGLLKHFDRFKLCSSKLSSTPWSGSMLNSLFPVESTLSLLTVLASSY
ncbi:predicted protein [Histoplasma mississippiense (nom. inval.)]|uniref:predicted protein n=1 Tax=Ajellomyces capsulatus (strain NAm1 / WU24) TaxID=2059318 RepID=UPI000157C1BB|nr:predicted protein [Histoplasma mississippiense (nom. inval.)]EDN07167.1 predicted protein [Histoplasma mississippiense (nom. inval.)]